ncbi:MAG: hypothetical protein JWN18_748 [Parcubacteria group bacterium]|nr:hypothetical protein [Parcubacteria group bacterium]
MNIRKFIPLLLAAVFVLTGGAAHAQTTTTTGTTNTTDTSTTGTSVTTPGIPSTGAGSAMPLNLTLLVASAAVGVLSGAYLLRRRDA